MAASDKDIVISPQRGSATSQPTIVFTGDGNDPLTLRVLDSATGSISIEGSAGQLFGVSNSLSTGSVFSANYASGIPAIDVDASGVVSLVPTVGKVGIGTTDPTDKLHIYGGNNNYTPTGSGSGLFKLSGGAASVYSMYIGIDNDGGYIGHNGSSRKLFFDVNESTRMTIDGSGNVGIGTTNPNHMLHVKGDISIDNESSTQPSMLHFNATNKDNLDPTSRINFWEGDTHTADYTTANAFIEYNGSTAGGDNGYLSIGGVVGTTPNVDVLTISRSGNVGIGTTNPSRKLHVNGEVLFYQQNNASSSYEFSADHYCHVDIVGDQDAGAGGPYLNRIVTNGTNGTLEFRHDSSINAVINSSGNIGIGTTDPSSKLHVDHTLTSTLTTILRVGAASRGFFDLKLSDETAGADELYHFKGNFISKNTYGLTIGTRATLAGSYTGTGEGAIRFYYPSAGGGAQAGTQIEFWTNENGFAGTSAKQQMTINRLGSVGIGTTNPNDILHTYKNADAAYVSFEGNQGRWIFGQVTSSYCQAGGLYGSHSGIAIDTSGNVGIGTTNPTDKLHIYNTATTGQIRIGGGNGANNHRIYINSHPTSSYLDSFGNGVYAPLRIEAAPLLLNSLSGGNVGISTTNPASKLAVNGYITESTDSGTTYWNVVTQQDVGTSPNQVPLNQYLGQLAFLDDFSPNGLRREGGSVDDVFVDSVGRVKIGLISDHTTTSTHTPVYISMQTDMAAFDDGEGAATTGLLRLEETGTNNNRYHGIDIRNRNQGDIRILNEDVATNDRGNLLIVVPDSDASDGTHMKMRFNSLKGSIQISGKGGAVAGNVDKEHTDVYIATKTGVTAVDTGAGGEVAGFIRFEDIGSNNNRYHGIDLRNRNSGDARILNYDEGAQNKASLVFATDNGNTVVEAMRITSSGNVGIGTTNPGKKLHIYSSNPLRLSDQNRTWDINIKDGKLVIGDDTASADRLTINTNGNVGIGDTNPGCPLEITITSASSYTNGGGSLNTPNGEILKIRNLDTTANNTAALATFHARGSTGTMSIWYAGNTGGGTTALSGAFVIGNRSSDPQYTERLRIDSSGNVGIGTTTPSRKLHVVGTSQFTSNVKIGSVIDIVPYDSLNNGTLSWEGSAGQLFSITNNLTTGSIFSVNDVSGIPSIDVDADGTVSIAPYSGNVGIGTINPVGKLDVWGDLILDSSGTTSRQIYFRNQDTNATGGGQIKSDQHLSLWAANAGGTTPTQYLTIQPGGNVGIGTTNPTTKLSVIDGEISSNKALRYHDDPSSAQPRGTLVFSFKGTSSASGQVLATLSTFTFQTMVVAKITWVGIYNWAGTGLGGGLCLAMTRYNTSNVWTNNNNNWIWSQAAGGVALPNIYWDNGVLKYDYGGSQEGEMQIEITWRSCNVTPNI